MKVIIAGDFCPMYRVAPKIENGEYAFVFGDIKPIIEQADYSIINLECPVCYGEEQPIAKCGPNLQCSVNGVIAVKWAGFDCVTLANNHFLDYGEEGVKNTLSSCQKYGLDSVGGGNSLKEASQILYKEKNGQILAIINCCEHEFSIATETTAGSNPLNPIQQYYAIKEAKENADYVMVIVHGGHEHYQLPSLRMQETYRFFVEAGADAVVNHHQHCYSGYEIYKGKPIFYGLGNFCFDHPVPVPFGWNEGIMLELELDNNGIRNRIIPYNQCKDCANVQVLSSDAFNERIDELNRIISDPVLLNKKKESYYNESMQSIALTIEPVNNRIIASLQSRNMLPLLWSKKSIVQLENYVMCESHRDKMEFFFRNYFNSKEK